MQRRLLAIVCGMTLVALVSLFVSYNRLVRSVELAAGSAGFVDQEPAPV